MPSYATGAKDFLLTLFRERFRVPVVGVSRSAVFSLAENLRSAPIRKDTGAALFSGRRG